MRLDGFPKQNIVLEARFHVLGQSRIQPAMDCGLCPEESPNIYIGKTSSSFFTQAGNIIMITEVEKRRLYVQALEENP